MLYFFVLFSSLELALCSYFPPKPIGVTTVESKAYDGASISFKQVGRSFPGVKPRETYLNIVTDYG
jgi:hypothetical protein